MPKWQAYVSWQAEKSDPEVPVELFYRVPIADIYIRFFRLQNPWVQTQQLLFLRRISFPRQLPFSPILFRFLISSRIYIPI